MKTNIRVRFAPSPTGPLHMGGVRTALYNYLFAKKYNGTFILRIEDTDQTRFVSNAEDYIRQSLDWCGISPEESPWTGGEYGPYRQSERKAIYFQYAKQLIDQDLAYYAFDTPEELEEMRERLKRAKEASPQYNNITRNSMKNSLTLPQDEVSRRLENGDPYVIRIKVPRNEEVRFHDEIRGWIVVQTNNMDDKVLFKSDGMPTYHLANIVDDYLMKISHVIRGEEWLPSAPLHVLLYKYLGWEQEMPKFAHLPLILRPDGNGKLSKRDGDRLGFPVFPLNYIDPVSGEASSGYREKGYLPQAFINMLALLGWNPGTEQEIFSLSELAEAFSLDRVGKAGARFDAEKTKWFNQQYLRNVPNHDLVEQLKPLILEEGLKAGELDLEAIVELMKERATFASDILNEGKFFFENPTTFDEQTVAKKWKPDSKQYLSALASLIGKVEPFAASDIEATVKAYMEENKLGFGAILPILRLAITGQGMGPSLFAICEILGKAETMSRLNQNIEKIGA